MRILVFRRGLLGDTVVAVAALRCLRGAFPDAHITLVSEAPVSGEISWPQRLLTGQGLVDTIVPFRGYNNPSYLRKVIALATLLPQLLRHHWDYCIHLDVHERTRSEFLLSRLLRIEKSIRAIPRPLVSPDTRVPNIVDELIGVLSPLPIELPMAQQGDISLPRQESERTWVDEWIARHPALHSATRPWIAVAPWSNMSAKEWPVERFTEVLFALRERHKGLTPILIGGPGDRARSTHFVESLGFGIPLTENLDPRLVLEMLSRCDIYLGIDTGPMHLAAAAGLPCVAIFSARDHAGRWEPYRVPRSVLRFATPCQGCMLRECVTHQKACVTNIQPSAVVQACLDLLPPSPSSREDTR